jgi:hypothetical protein
MKFGRISGPSCRKSGFAGFRYRSIPYANATRERYAPLQSLARFVHDRFFANDRPVNVKLIRPRRGALKIYTAFVTFYKNSGDMAVSFIRNASLILGENTRYYPQEGRIYET